MSRTNWRQLKYNKVKKAPMMLEGYSENSFITAVAAAVVHVRRVMKREHHLDCRDERVGAFVTSLRRELGNQNISYMKNVCKTDYYKDAGVLNTTGLATSQISKLNHLFQKGVEMAGSKGDANFTIHELSDLVDAESKINSNMNDINKEADKVLEGFKELVASM